MYFIGLDIGTTGLKAGIVDEEGALVASVYRETGAVSTKPGKMEQDVDEILINTLKVTAEVLEKAGVRSGDIGAVMIDGQMAGIVGIDRDFDSITGLDSNLDMQSEKYSVYMHERFGDLLARTSSKSSTPGLRRKLGERSPQEGCCSRRMSRPLPRFSHPMRLKWGTAPASWWTAG